MARYLPHWQNNPVMPPQGGFFMGHFEYHNKDLLTEDQIACTKSIIIHGIPSN